MKVLPVFTITFLFCLLQANSQAPDLTLVPAVNKSQGKGAHNKDSMTFLLSRQT